MYLFFDTETTGLPAVYGAPAHHLDNWPRLVQLAWILTDDEGNELSSAEYIVKPDGFKIPWRAAWVHGITTRTALKRGVSLVQALDAFTEGIQKADVLIAHNMAFDEKIVGAEFLRTGRPNHLEPKRRRCTMKWSARYCGIMGPRGYKWPNLQELHRKLFKKRFGDAHHALADVRACARCYFELRRLQIMP
jgi:DNA polymerase III subunit epsilon